MPCPLNTEGANITRTLWGFFNPVSG